MTGAPLGAALLEQAAFCAELGSPFTARLLTILAGSLTEESPLGPRLLGWPGDLSGRGDSVPLRLAGAFHALVLSGEAPALAAAYPPHQSSDAALQAALLDALHQHADRIGRFLDSPPQTNEVARSAVLIAAAHWLHARHPLPLHLSELGASAGLNLRFDRFALRAGATRLGPEDASLTLLPGWQGPAPDPAPVTVADRRGADIAPIDTTDPAQRLRLRAYVWADQSERLRRLDQALALPPATVDCSDAAAWLSQRLVAHLPGRLHLVYHTVAWQYFPPDTQAACLQALHDAGRRATSDAPLAHLSMEGDGLPRGAALSLTLWPRGETVALGRADFHGRWVHWTA